MRFTDAIRSKLQSTVSNLPSMFKAPQNSQQVVDIVSTNPFFSPPPADTVSLLALYKTSPWVRTIVGKVGHAVGKQPWYLEKKDGTRIDDHPALAFIREGCKGLRGRRALAVTTMHVDLAAESHWAIGRDASGKPASYAPMPPNWIITTPNRTETNYIIQPRFGIQFRVAPEDVLSFIDVDPANPYGRGASLTGAANVELATDGYAANFLASFFSNYARPDLVVSGTADNELDDVSRARLEAVWNEKLRGVKKRGKPLFSNGPLEVQEIGSGLRDNQVADVRDQLKSVISEIYGIPPEILGRLDASNRATIESADYLFAAHVVEPRLSMMLDTLEPFLELEFNLSGAGLKLCYDTPAKDDAVQKLAAMQAQPDAFSRNEYRVNAGFRPLPRPDFDEPILDHKPDPVDLMGGNPDDPDAADEAKEPPGANDEGDKEPPTPPKGGKSVDKSMSESDIFSVADAHEDPSVVAEATRLMREMFSRLLDVYGAELLEQLQTDVTFELNSAVVGWIRERTEALIEQTGKTTKSALQSALDEGAALGESEEQLAARIDDLFQQAADVRSALIGDTEATALTGFGSLTAGKQAGFTQKTWLTSHDQLVRASHAAMDGQVRNMDEDFKTPDGATAQYPGDFGDPGEDINCRCAMRPILPGEKSIKTTFGKWHARAFDTVSTDVASMMGRIFHAQAVVAKAQLHRKFAGR